MNFKLTTKQLEAQKIIVSDSTHCMLFGGARSGKTFLLLRNLILRALKSPGSRHCILRFRFNRVKTAIGYDTFPKVMKLAFPGVTWKLNKSDWFISLKLGAEQESVIWLGGLDDKERTEKILGHEYATIYLNECSEISLESRNIAITRLAQKTSLKLRFFYDCNPPSKGHWTYKIFIKKIDPTSNKPLTNSSQFAFFKLNPVDNKDNLPPSYLQELDNLPSHLRTRFFLGEYVDDNPNALFKGETIDKYRLLDEETPKFIRIGVGVDPSGAWSEKSDTDAIGIIVAGLAVDGNCYVLEDCTLVASPLVWGKVVANAFERYNADFVVAETNFGGGMVKHVIQSAKPDIPFIKAIAAKSKTVRAEPFSALYEQGKVRHVGNFEDLEAELISFSTTGYLGEKSPNRADALIWVLSVLFPQVVNNFGIEKEEPIITKVETPFRRRYA